MDPFRIFSLLIAVTVLVIAVVLFLWIRSLKQKIRTGRILTYFATSLYGQNTVDDIFWDLAKNCISQLKLEDCVIYQYNKDKQVLVQRAAFGPKNPEKHDIFNPIEIPLGKGIVGTVAKTGKAEIVSDTTSDPRYILDDEARCSEITVPIIIDGEVFGIIDSEHSRRNFYTKWHLSLLEQMAEICAVKISKYIVEEKLRVKIARDLHDEMGSTLTSINIISKMALEQESNDATRSQLSKIKEHSSTMMETMSDIVWAINPANDSFETVLIRMKEFIAEIMEPAGINYFFRVDNDLDLVSVNLEQRKDIYMIFKEAVNNAVKYSGATEVNTSIRWKEGWLQMVIMDNGKGFDLDQHSSGNGLRNMYGRAKEMGAEIRIDSIPGTGSSVFLRVPVTSLG
jgi:signal transduction histidine kinase